MLPYAEFVDKQVTLESIQNQVMVITLEASTEASIDFTPLTRLKHLFSDFSNYIKQTLHGAFTSQLSGQTYLKVLDKTTYADLMTTEIYKPVGLKVTFIEYLEKLGDSVSYSEQLISRTLIPFKEWVGSALGDPKLLKRVVGPEVYKPNELEKLTKQMSKCFNHKDRSDREKYKKLIGRNNDWTTVTDMFNNLNERQNQTGIKEVQNHTNELAHQLNVLQERIAEDSMTYAMSKNAIKDLAEAIEGTARAVSFFAYVGTRLSEFSVVLEDNLERLKQITE